MGFKGSVESFSLADVFQNLSMNQQTGTLKIVADSGDEKHVYFDVGHVKHMARGLHKPLLAPDVFLAHGLVLKMQLEPALERAKANNEFIGPVLIELGLIAEAQLSQIFKHQIEEEIFDLFSWEKANFEFNEGPPAEGMFQDQLDIQLPSLPISHLIMEAARRVDEWERLKALIPESNEIYAMDLPIRKAIEKGEMEVDPVEKRIATLIDGARDVNDIIEESFLFKFEVMSAISSFLQSSLIRSTTLQELHHVDQDVLQFAAPPRRIKVLERILFLGGENEQIRRSLADLLVREARIDSACLHYNALAEMELQHGHENEAIELYRRILEISPKDVKAHEQLAALYNKRGQRREAFVHYQELFETLRDQNHNDQARSAGLKALECDPTQSDLRACLVDLLLADNQKESASTQLELLGDQAAKVGNVKLAADSYRRAMQYMPSNRQLRKKLSDVMLTKEDRSTRKKRMVLITIALIFSCAAVSGLVVLEYLNSAEYSRACDAAQSHQNDGTQLGLSKKFDESIAQYQAAKSSFDPLSYKISPFMRYNKKAAEQIEHINHKISDMEHDRQVYKEDEEKRSKKDLVSAEDLYKKYQLEEAKKVFQGIVDNTFSAAEDKKKSEAKIEELHILIGKLEEGRKRLNRKPSEAFASLEEEVGFKRAFVQQYSKNPNLLENIDIKLPLWIKPETDLVDVFLNGALQGTISRAAGRELNTFRYSMTGTHRFEFRKTGYRTVTFNTSETLASFFALKMEREVSYVFDLSSALGADLTLSGECLIEGDSLYTGTAEGSLLEISLSEKKIVRRYDLPGMSGLNTEVYGAISLQKRADKSPLILYCTKAGDCVALTPIEKNNEKGVEKCFQEVWPPLRGKAAQPLTAQPVVMKLPILSRAAVLLLPIDKKLLVIDSESGAAAKSLEVKASITSPPVTVTVEQGPLIVVGCEDGNIYGLSLNGDLLREWKTNARAAAVRGRPFTYEDLLIAGVDDGNLYHFELKKSGFGTAIPLEGEIVMEPLLLKKRLYVGSTRQAGFWCVDMVMRQPSWRYPERDTGGLTHAPTLLDNQIYFVTDKGRLFAIDLDKGSSLWSYQVEGGSAFTSAPKVVGKRVYIITKSGKILGFDEQSH